MTIALVAALAHHRVIGVDNRLPWHLSEDLKRFKELTMGKVMVMGRKTFDSIGKPLPGRTSIVVTRQRDWHYPGVHVSATVEAALSLGRTLRAGPDQEIMVIGGSEIYRQTLPLASRLYLTWVDIEVEGDALFPEWEIGQWVEAARESGRAEKDGLKFAWIRLDRIVE